MASEPIFVDSSMFKALLDAKDDFYPTATEIWNVLQELPKRLITTNFILDETYTLLRKRIGIDAVIELRDRLLVDWPSIKIVRVTAKDEADAWQWFQKDWSDLSFTDCVSFAVMKRLGITHVATFDQHFARAGFTIVKPEPAILTERTS